jgi:putative phage-type endonuclease
VQEPEPQNDSVVCGNCLDVDPASCLVCQPPPDDWHTWRRGGIGGSDIAALLGLSSYASPWSVWCHKVGLLEPTDSTQRQRIGTRMEPVLAAELHDDTGLYVVGAQQRCQDVDRPYFRCTVDGFVSETPDGQPFDALGVWEAKTDGRFGWPDGIPVNIRAQCIWNMGVTGTDHAWLTVMFAGFKIETYPLELDGPASADLRLMRDVAEAFWRDHVLTNVPPPPDGSDATADAIAEVWPKHQEGVAVELPDDLVGRWQVAKAREKAAKEEAKALRNQIAAAIGDAEIGTVDGAPAVTYRQQDRDGYTVEPTSFRVLRDAPKPRTRGKKGNAT